MEVIDSYKSCSGFHRHVHIVRDKPHKQSLAALLLINKYYMFRDPEAYPQTKWKIFKNNKREVLMEHFNRFGKYVCAYCKRDDLKVNVKSSNVQKATIDHIVPLSRGGSLISKKNMMVCCSKCNNKKGNSTTAEFLVQL